MDVLLALTIGVVCATSVYLFLARDLARGLIGFVMLGIAVNLTILVAGRIGTMAPPLIGADAETLAQGAANPLPQALILTAIVIGFGLAAFALMLILQHYRSFGTTQSDHVNEAEADDSTPYDVPPEALTRQEQH